MDAGRLGIQDRRGGGRNQNRRKMRGLINLSHAWIQDRDSTKLNRSFRTMYSNASALARSTNSWVPSIATTPSRTRTATSCSCVPSDGQTRQLQQGRVYESFLLYRQLQVEFVLS